MTPRNAIAAAAILTVLAGAGAAAAAAQQGQQTQWERDYGRGQASVPQGSYRSTCRNIDFRNQVLRATCTNRAGQGVNSTIDPRTCQSRDIYNDNGILRCGAQLPGASQLPAGSYRSTCNNPSVRNNILTASCVTRQGRYLAARLDLRQCRANAPISNENGVLSCREAEENRPLPIGSYRSTCTSAAVRDNILTANCTTRQNRYVAARLDLRQCRPNSEIYNDNGVLNCDARGGRGPDRGGNFEAVIYTEANYRGRQLMVTDANADLTRSGFNDRVRSIRILRGRTQVCVDVQYRGRCETLNQSVADLRSLRMDNVISSIRGQGNGGGRGRGYDGRNDRDY